MIRNLLEDEFNQKERVKIVDCVWKSPNLDMTLVDPDDTHIWAPSRCVAEDPAGQRKWAKAPPSRHQNEYLIHPGLALIGWPCIFQVWDAISTDTCSLLSNFSSNRLIMRSSCGPENLRGRAREGVFVLMRSFSQTDQRPVYSTSGSIFRESGILFSGLFGALTNISLCWYPPPLPNTLLTVCTYLY